MASKARARSTWAAGALSERLRRVKAIRSSGVSGRRGSFWRRDMVYLEARGSPATIPNLTASDPLVGHLPWGVPYWAASDGEVPHVTASERSAAPLERRREESTRTTEPIAECTGSPGCPCPGLTGCGRGAELHEGGPVGWASHRRHRRALGSGLQPRRPGCGGAAPRRWPPGLLW